MKRALAVIFLLICAGLVIRDLTGAVSIASDINDQEQAIGLFERGNGDMTRPEETGYLNNAYQACSYRTRTRQCLTSAGDDGQQHQRRRRSHDHRDAVTYLSHRAQVHCCHEPQAWTVVRSQCAHAVVSDAR